MLTPHQQAALNIDKHISLTANAGSGKTFVLSKRYLEIALKKEVSLRNIAAITFTDKAASELYKKIANEIEAKMAETVEPKLKRKLEILRRQLVSANISTIHSFCIDILRQFPVEAGIDANFTPIDETASNELVELSIEDIINHKLNNHGDEELKNLIRLFGSKTAFSKQLFYLIKNRKNVLTCADNIYRKDVPGIAEFFNSSFNYQLQEIVKGFEEELINSIRRINDSVLAIKADNETGLKIASSLAELTPDLNVIEKLFRFKQIMGSICTDKGTVKIRGYFKDEFNRFAKEKRSVEKTNSLLKQFEFEYEFKKINNALAKFGKDVLNIFSETAALYNIKKTENGYLDFEDILLLTQNIILHSDVRNYLSSQYKYIMIDEYQDTNELQYNIFLPILDGLRKNNLFVVGDEKQSIYMFRDAELEVFRRTKNDIKNSSGSEQLLSLPDSFRMSPAICLFTNTLFGNLFQNPHPRFNEVAHSDLVCARSDEMPGSVELLAVKKEKTENDEAEIEFPEAELTAKKIIQIRNADAANWNDIAILCRKRKPFAELEKVFIRYKIPFTIIGGKGFYQRQSIYDIYNYFSFLLDNGNDTALVGILRSPFFTISDTEIYKLSLIEGNNYFDKLKTKAQSEFKFKNILALLQNNVLLSRNSDIPLLLRKILDETGYISVLASRKNGVQETANINKLIKLTIQFNAKGFKTLYDYVNWLKESIESFEDEAQAALADDSNSVNIMTVHQSKGLEYPYVFLYKCADTAQSNSVKAKQIRIDKNFGLLTKLPLDDNYFGDYQSAPIISVVDYINKRKNLAELKRLFYVAVTRAKDHLIISSEVTDKLPNEDSFIGLLRDGLEIDFNEEKLHLSGNLNYLINENGFKNISKSLSIDIPILKEIICEPKDEREEDEIKEIHNYYINPIDDLPSNEIISATKVAVFAQCPVKYQLTYDYGFTKIISDYKNWKSKNTPLKGKFDFNPAEDVSQNEDDEHQPNFADVKGRIIHNVLQKNIPSVNLENFVDSAIHREIDVLTYDVIAAAKMKEEIINNLKGFFLSEAHKKLSEYKNYFNEYEVYIKENDYFLYGIIDKLIIDDNKIIIVDYKTDDIAPSDIPERAANYLIQLKFYSYIAYRLLQNFDKIILKLVFIKHPDENVEIILLPEQISGIGEEIRLMTKAVRSGEYIKNINHCSKCLFSLNNKDCIKE